MYNTEQEKFFLQQSKLWIANDPEKDHLDELKQIIDYADWKYYVMDNPVLSDGEYDTLFKKLKQLESRYPELITADSPTQRVAKSLTQSFPTVNHLVPMLSLENSYDANDLIEWDRKCRELSGEQVIEYCVEPKFDGASISLLFEDDLLLRGATRGDGVQGDDITTNTRQIRSIPMGMAIGKKGISLLEVRGEVVLTKEKFKQYNERLIAEGIPLLANPRNAASGSLRIKDSTEVSKRGLDAFLYHISFWQTVNGERPYQTHYESLQLLHALGCKTSLKDAKLFQGITEVIDYCAEIESGRDALPYEIDGAVIKINRIDLQDKIGQTSHHPRWAMAYKFKARQASSKLLQVEYQVGRTGSVTPVAKIEPVSVGGVTVSSISLFNEEVVKEKNLMIGDTLLIERAGDVIPYVVKSFPELRTGIETPIIFPVNCPVCREVLYKPEAEAVWRCTNINCKAQVIERIIHFASKDAMDIRGLGDALVRKFYEQGFLNTIDGIYHIPFEQMKGLEGFGEKSILNLQQSIEKSKTQPLNRLIFALGIRYVGETTAKTLARSINHLHDLYDMSAEQLCQLEDIGGKVAGSLVDFFSHPDNRRLIESLELSGLQLQNMQNVHHEGGSLNGKTFLFTGTLTMKRSEAEALAEAAGGSILGSVSTKLNYLVVGEDAGSKLEKAKKLGTVIILTEEEFMRLIK
ncbi:MAG: NAD-dependent DNA ligase LigA [Chitinophagaceae bacterium]|nr:NAD-dependent DNA ligase LigA [Chitinophagaceae bacterium]